ncbi:hypothetical protein SAMN05421686_10740 [Thalassolituus maritimus]|jgi:hypothetical protein|uniref:Uncharacterized protein n=1 Tax=Thalassolituus maritimus TaxID=484498 RepID=A0A1N7NIM2_9GAMM|nr:hypothetical protein [Thalassolituus maritimus]SIS98111.1 hypothetical protein SAMN05421686_10740 [Thalassolituus maritimus]
MTEYLIFAAIAFGVSGASFCFGLFCDRIATDIEAACRGGEHESE